MRVAIGGTWITQLVIVLMFIFSAFLALSMNYSRAFGVKNEVISIIEKKGGLTNSAVEIANNYLKSINYKEVGTCQKGSYGVNINTTATTGRIEQVTDQSKKYNYCVTKLNSASVNFKHKSFYEVEMFFRFNLPVIGNIFTFKVHGQSKDIPYPMDNDKSGENCSKILQQSQILYNKCK